MDKHDTQRRRILYGMLTAGCAATVPILFVGCGREDTPPDPQTTGSGTGTGTGTGTGSGLSPAPTDRTAAGNDAAEGVDAGKMSKVQARYQDQPNGDQQCGNCMNFIAGDNTCKAVQGQVSPEGWCSLWNKLA